VEKVIASVSGRVNKETGSWG